MTRRMTKSKAAVPSLQIFVKFAGATFSKPCHLQVQELRLPEEVLDASLFVIMEAKMMVKRDANSPRKEMTVEEILR